MQRRLENTCILTIPSAYFPILTMEVLSWLVKDQVAAEYKDGVLSLTIPKSPKEATKVKVV